MLALLVRAGFTATSFFFPDTQYTFFKYEQNPANAVSVFKILRPKCFILKKMEASFANFSLIAALANFRKRINGFLGCNL